LAEAARRKLQRRLENGGGRTGWTALKRISARIDMEKIRVLINETPTLLPVQKEFYTVMISERKAKIIDYTMEQLMKLEQQETMHEEQQDHGQQFSV